MTTPDAYTELLTTQQLADALTYSLQHRSGKPMNEIVCRALVAELERRYPSAAAAVAEEAWMYENQTGELADFAYAEALISALPISIMRKNFC